jgi:hypothetical protein
MTFKKYLMIWLGIAFATIYWIIEALIHVFAFVESSFLQQLIPNEINEVWMRSFTSLLIISFGYYAHLQINKIIKSNKEKEDIQKRLADVLSKTLNEFIPICANCKKIRLEDSDHEEQQSWVHIESYISNKTSSQFTHGICPECMKKLYEMSPNKNHSSENK